MCDEEVRLSDTEHSDSDGDDLDTVQVNPNLKSQWQTIHSYQTDQEYTGPGQGYSSYQFRNDNSAKLRSVDPSSSIAFSTLQPRPEFSRERSFGERTSPPFGSPLNYENLKKSTSELLPSLSQESAEKCVNMPQAQPINRVSKKPKKNQGNIIFMLL